jgi:hypothetical protein
VSRSIKIITGIPRSGTTLCCNLINQRQDAFALHEPINPSDIPKTYSASQAADSIVKQITQFDRAIEQGLPFAHGDKGGLTIDNPVGHTIKNGVRQVVAQRGMVQLPPHEKNSYELVIKQNALFTALMPMLVPQFPMICIVRNPVDVLLSWLTVDLPINRGHIPAGERFDAALKNSLQGAECLSRQMIIYQWFMQRFLWSSLPCIRYEDIVSSDGAVLDQALGWEAITRGALSTQIREFDNDTLCTLKQAIPSLLALNCGDLYTQAEIKMALNIQGL